jgi:hypothetical protein
MKHEVRIFYLNMTKFEYSTFTRMPRNTFFLLLTILLCQPGFAQQTRLAPAPDWIVPINPDATRKPDSKVIRNGYYLDLLDYQSHPGRQTEYVHFIRHIVNESGVQNASEVSVNFAPAYEQVRFHTVALIRDGKVINHLSASQIKVIQEERESSDYLYNGEKRAFIVLKDVRKEDKIEVAYSITGFNPVFANRYTKSIYFSSGTAICNYFETVIVPAGRKLNFRTRNGASNPVIQQIGGAQVYRWMNPVIQYWEDQPGVPSWFDNTPAASFSEYNSWKEVADWGLVTFKQYNYPLPEGLKNKIAAWRTQSKGDKAVFARLAIQFVQDQVRYLGMEIGANTHQPYPPAEVFKQRFGDCKDKALLLTMILRSEHIPAYMALVNTSLRDKLTEAMPSPTVFNHVIVAIQQPTGWRFVDATSSSQQGELASRYIPAFGQVLIVQENSTSLTPVAPGPLHKTTVTETLVVTDGPGNSMLEVVSLYEGGAADHVRSTLSETSFSEMHEDYLKYYTKIFSGIKKDQDIVITDDSLNNQVTVKETYLIPELWQHTEQKEKFDAFARVIYDYLPANPSNLVKDYPQALDFPRNISYNLVLKMPEPWPFTADAVHIKNDSYEYSFIPVADRNVITLQYNFRTFKDHIPTAAIAQYKADYKELESTLNFEIYRHTNLTAGRKAGAVKAAAPADLNTTAIWFSIVFILVLIPLYRHLNNRSEPVAYTAEPAQAIRGWTAFLGVCIAIGGLAQFYSLFSSGYYTNSYWIALYNAGGSMIENIIYIALGISLFFCANTVMLFYWYLHKRDIFPKMFIAYIISLLAGQLVMMLIYSRLSGSVFASDRGENITIPFFRTLFYGALWIRYMTRSEGAKSTFIRNFKGDS